MKKLLFVVLGLIVLLVAAVAVLPGAIDWRPRIAAMVHSATGRTLTIGGPLHIALLPSLSVSASDIRLSNAPGAPGVDMASIGSISLQAELLPLLRGKLVVDRLDVAHPTVLLEVDRDGKPNWLMQPPGKPATPKESASSGGGAAGALTVRSVHVDQGHFTYRDAVTGQVIEAKNITLTGGTAGGAGRLDWKLGLTLNDEPVSATFTLDSLDKLQGDKPATIAMRVTGKHLTASYQGTAQARPEPGLNGTFDLKIPSVGGLFAWLRNPLAGADPGPLTLHLETVSSGGKLDLRNAALTGKAIKATAQAHIDATQTPPSFDASINVAQADLDAYMPPAGQPAPTPTQPAPAQPAQAAPAPAQPATGWSTAPFDFTALGKLNGRLKLLVAALRYHGLDITHGDFEATLAKRVLRLTKGQIHLAGGTIDTTATLDAAAAQPKLELKTDIAGVQARPLLTALAGSDRLGGAIAFHTALTTSGRNQAAMVKALAGNGSVRITNGAIYGINLAQTLRRVGSLGLGNPKTEKTDFAELGGTFTVRDGVIDNRDMKMLAPLLRLTGAGTVSLPARTLDYATEAKLVASLAGQGGTDALAGVPIPIRITGPWAAPQLGVDWNNALRSLASDPTKLKALPGELDKAMKNFGIPLPGQTGTSTDQKTLIPGLTLPKNLFGK